MLLEALQAGEREACGAFVDAHYRALYRFFRWLVNDREAAEDLTQETFAAFWQSLPGLEPARVPDLKAWLYGIARNCWRRRCRQVEPASGPWEEEEALADGRPGPEATALAALEADRVARAIADLPADYREALVLRVFEELDYRQLAAVLGIAEPLARWRVHHARRWLRGTLAAPEEEPVAPAR